MTDYKTELWEDFAGDSFSQADLYPMWEGLTTEQRATIAKGLASCADTMSEHAAPTPSYRIIADDAESEKVRMLRNEITELEAKLGIFKAQVGRDHKVSPENLFVNSLDEIEVSR